MSQRFKVQGVRVQAMLRMVKHRTLNRRRTRPNSVSGSILRGPEECSTDARQTVRGRCSLRPWTLAEAMGALGSTNP